MLLTRRFSRLMLLVLALLTLTGCFSMYQRDHSTRSSLVEFLYPERFGYVETRSIPHLRLPLRVGVAFTPVVQPGIGGFTAMDQTRLADQVAENFRSLNYVSTIEVIPGEYLRPQGGFQNLDQLRSLFGIDIIVLLSFDQSVFTDEGIASLTYWTIVGAYTVPGEKNDTHTLLDAAVYDIESRKLLFRAPGTSLINSRATLVANSEQLREDSGQGFNEAGAMLADNLAVELEEFNQRVRDMPDEVEVSRRPGYAGAGSVDLVFFAVLALSLGTGLVSARRHV